MHRRTRWLLVAEALLGVAPLSTYYIYLLPANLFWQGQVARQALRASLHPFTTAVAVLLLLGGLGLLSLWITLLRRLAGGSAPGRILQIGLALGMVSALGAIGIFSALGALWIDLYLYGAPLLVAAHQLVSGLRSEARTSRTAQHAGVTAAILLGCLLPTEAADAAARPRLAAEWEPALGALVSWPPIVPDELLVEIARDDRLFVMVEDAAKQEEARLALTKLGVVPPAVEFITAPAGNASMYTRDWGPSALFDRGGAFHLADPRFVDYPISTSPCDARLFSQKRLLFSDFKADDDATRTMAATLGVPILKLPFTLTGGNTLVDGHGTAFSACIMLNENRRYLGIERDGFLRSVEEQLGISRYFMVPNFEWLGIQHIDCLLKLLDEETLLVKRPPEDHPEAETIEEIVRYLSTLEGPYGRPYRILRIDTPPYLLGYFLASYTNSLILNRKVLVPLFGIPADAQAIETWRAAMPGYQVLGFENRERYGWNWTDALHCRVRAVWDPQMLYMSHRRIESGVPPASSYPLEVRIHDYSRRGLAAGELKVAWRLRGEAEWHQIPLRPGSQEDQFTAALPGAAAGQVVEYYFAAADLSGRRETLPRVAPAGFYSFTIGRRERL